MQYLSITWLAWMWITVSIYWLSPRAWRMPVLVLISLLFLASVSPASAAILTIFCLLCHYAGNYRHPDGWLIGAVVTVMVGVLAFYKIGQAIESENLLATAVLPLGVSYYSFRCIHFLLERYKGHVDRATLPDLIGYLFFIPTFVIGPIHRFDDYLHDLRRQRFDIALLSEGGERILYGYAKIAILSNFLIESQFGGWIAGLEAGPEAPQVVYLNLLRDGLNLYFQFSGYSDIAIGFSRLLGFRIIENFNWPYLQSNISAFWRSWHISLTNWCRDYIYGVVVSNFRSPALGALATMIAVGLWHEVSLRFVLWGAYHGVGLMVWQWLQKPHAWIPETPERLALPVHVVKVLFTFHFVLFGFAFFVAETPLQAVHVWARLLFFWV